MITTKIVFRQFAVFLTMMAMMMLILMLLMMLSDDDDDDIDGDDDEDKDDDDHHHHDGEDDDCDKDEDDFHDDGEDDDHDDDDDDRVTCMSILGTYPYPCCPLLRLLLEYCIPSLRRCAKGAGVDLIRVLRSLRESWH